MGSKSIGIEPNSGQYSFGYSFRYGCTALLDGLAMSEHVHGWVAVAACGARNTKMIQVQMIQAQMRPANGRCFRRGGIMGLVALAV